MQWAYATLWGFQINQQADGGPLFLQPLRGVPDLIGSLQRWWISSVLVSLWYKHREKNRQTLSGIYLMYLWRWKKWEAVRACTELLTKYDHKQPCMTYRLILGHYEILASSQKEWMDAWLSIDSNCYFGCLCLPSDLKLWNLTLQIQIYFAFPCIKPEFNLQRIKKKKKRKQKQDNYLGNWKCQRSSWMLCFSSPTYCMQITAFLTIFNRKYLEHSFWLPDLSVCLTLCKWLQLPKALKQNAVPHHEYSSSFRRTLLRSLQLLIIKVVAKTPASFYYSYILQMSWFSQLIIRFSWESSGRSVLCFLFFKKEALWIFSVIYLVFSNIMINYLHIVCDVAFLRYCSWRVCVHLKGLWATFCFLGKQHMSLQSKQTFHFALDHYTTCSPSATAALSTALSCGFCKFCLHLKILLLCGSTCETCTKHCVVPVGCCGTLLCNSTLWNDVWGRSQHSGWLARVLWLFQHFCATCQL